MKLATSSGINVEYKLALLGNQAQLNCKTKQNEQIYNWVRLFFV